ncbi:MAG: hypothetical protein U9R70_11375 [Pseudomonadota bacterium]|nr:hypothetical protein [Pseudomonadota bacterium]
MAAISLTIPPDRSRSDCALRHAVTLKDLKDSRQGGRPPGLEVDDVLAGDIGFEVRKGDIVHPDRQEEIGDLVAALHRDGEVDFVFHALLVQGGGGNDEDEFRRVMANGVFDVVPEQLPADQLGDIRPDFIAGAGELNAKPSDEIVLLRIGMADEDEATAGSGGRWRRWQGHG